MEYKYYLPKNFDKLSFDDLTFDQFEDMDEAARKLFEKDYINLAWQKASKEMQDKAKKFVKKYLRKEDVAKEFIWESLSDERQKEIKEEVIGSRRQRRNAEAANKISKAFKNFKTKKQKEGDIKKEKLNKLIQEGHNIREFLEHGEDKSEVFFDFKEPVPGCKYNIGKAKGFIAIPMQQKDFRLFLSDLEKYSYYVIEQLYDQINKTLDVDVQAVCLMQKEENTQQRTDHSGWHNIHSRNGIPSTCESIRSKTEAKLLLPKSKSGMSFKEGILMKITYRADHTRTKKEKRTKNKGGKWIDHMSIPCFQNRERDLKKLRNYSFKNKDSYIFNFTNFDDLCFLRNIILVKFMCEIKNNKLLPLIEPTHIDEFYPYLPLIKYPNKRFNEEAQNLFNKYSHYIKANNFPYEYILECKKFAEMLNNSHMFPINADDADLIKQFETLNGITINIFYLDQEAYNIKQSRKRLDQLWAAKYMTERKAKDIRINTHLDLLLIREIIPGESIPPVYNSHFVFLLDAIELGTNQRGRNPHTLQCIKCKEYFNGRSLESSNKMLSLHLENDECVERTVKYKIPHDRELKYKHYYTAYAKEFIIYADFEAINKKLIQDFVDTDEFNFENNKQITQHEIIAARYLIMVNDSHLNPREDHPMFGKSYEFKGRDDKTVLQAFIKSLIDTCNELSKELNAKIDYSNLSNEEKHKLNQQTKCFVCGNTFKDYKDKHLHHDHQIEKNNVIAYACQRCNTQMTEKRRAGIPVIFHNGSHYDWKFLMQEVGSIIEKEYPDQQNIDLTNKQSIENVEVLGLNSENYITIKWNNMWFLDSFKFMSSSLSALVKTLTKDDLELAKKLYKLNGIKEEEVSILSQKNIFPYIWFDSYDKFSEKALPERKYFESNDDYEYALKAWDILKCKTFEDYHDMYLIADVVLLATCFHAFRKNIYNMHKTDPAYFLGLPGLSWSIAMKHLPQGKAIELLEKPEHYLMFQNSLQGGICQVFQRYAKKRDATQILYLDVNGLYAHIMANMKLPYKLVDYNLDTKESYSYSKIKELCEDEEHTYFFIIDATISELMIERNPALKYLPFFPVKINEKEIQKSKWMKGQCDKHKIHDVDTYKLATVLERTEKYLVHIKYLKLAMDAGYEIKEVHGYFKFAQDYIYKKYIDGNNHIKGEATKSGNKFLRQLAKDLSNIIYGKNIQNILKQRDYEIIFVPDNNQVTRLNHINKINSVKNISDKLMIVEKDKKTKHLNMPIFIGKAILDLTKHLMYDFFYNVVIKNYKDAKLLYMDTDSFIIEIPDNEEGLSNFILNNKEHFDLSECENKNLPLYHHLQEKKKELGEEEFNEYINYGVPGKFKNETKWYSIEEFVALRPKQYSYITESGDSSIKAKGLTKTATKRHLSHQMFVDQVLGDQNIISCKMSNIQSKNFKTYTQYIYKKALVNYENKRYWLDSIYSLPFGHPWINKIENRTMKIEEAVDKLKGKDDYTYELNAYKINKVLPCENIEAKKLNNILCMTNINEEALDILANRQSDLDVLANPNGLMILRNYIKGEESEDEFEF